ncbi:MAG: long-chain fatty acid--CoA ligase, partial [Calditrichaeota bacterium]
MEKQKSHYVTDWLDKRAKLTPNRVALVDTVSGSTLTFAEWNARANRTAHFLKSLGVEKYDRVSVYASNCAEHLDLLFACGKIGAILHNLNWRLTVHELRGILAGAAPKVLVYSQEWSAQVNALRPGLSSTQLVALGKPAEARDKRFSQRDRFPDTLQPCRDLHPDDPWGIYYTGGTTGLPKGAVLTHGNMTWNSVNTITSWGLTAEDSAPLQ